MRPAARSCVCGCVGAGDAMRPCGHVAVWLCGRVALCGSVWLCVAVWGLVTYP